jgi:nitrite reductase/ring-hydroxylating ferredoxin subunit
MGLLHNIFGGNKEKLRWFQVFESESDAIKNIPLNKSVLVQIEEQKICLSRTSKGYFAVQDACPHLGISLSKGNCNNFGEIVCPWHGYRFDLKLGHETSGQGTGLGVQVFKVEMRDTGLYIGVV